MAIKRIVGGALVIASFPFGLLDAANALSYGIPEQDICGVALIIISIVALTGGVAAVVGKDFGHAMAGAICACFTGGPFFIGTAFGIAGAVLVGLSKEEFVKSVKGVDEGPPGVG